MRIIYFDIDSLRADHLGCYGYKRNTSPNIDSIAREGVRFENCYVSDSPCLPSRSAMFTGKFGIHSGVVGHGGTAADPYIVGATRGFNKFWTDNNKREHLGFVELLKEAGFYTVSVSPFAERHASWWFYAGFREMFNTGKRGDDIAKEISACAIPWLRQNATKDNWFLHINVWDPHVPYRTPKDEKIDLGETPQQAKWLTKELLKKHRESFGPHSARETTGFGSREEKERYIKKYPETPRSIDSLNDFYKLIDLYDQGIRYADTYFGEILKILKENKILDDTAVIITSDHGENIGELNVYADHLTADYITCRTPFILKWPGLKTKKVDFSFHYQVDAGATILELLGIEVPISWDGKSFSKSLLKNKPEEREFLVVSSCAWTCQRSVIFKDWIMIKTYHEGLKDFPEIMLFNTKKDPHEINDLACKNPKIVKKCLQLLDNWHKEMMDSSDIKTDPMDTVIKEGGPWHTRSFAQKYAKRLTETGRQEHAKKILTWLKEGKYWQ
ncbi:MAG: sulfatase [Candidatus Firestonebacteria bacterium]